MPDARWKWSCKIRAGLWDGEALLALVAKLWCGGWTWES